MSEMAFTTEQLWASILSIVAKSCSFLWSMCQVLTSLHYIETCSSFADFVKAFSQFGNDMVALAHLSGDRQNVSTQYLVSVSNLHFDDLTCKILNPFHAFSLLHSKVQRSHIGSNSRLYVKQHRSLKLTRSPGIAFWKWEEGPEKFGIKPEPMKRPMEAD